MAQRFNQLTEQHIRFIAAQKIYFVATATAESRINLSPKGMDSLRVVSPSRVVWLNLTGSGNETAAHVQQDPRMTMMFCAFEGDPLILRLYGNARAVHRKDPQWSELMVLFNPLPGARQIFDMSVDLVQTSCGFGVPTFSYSGERDLLYKWAQKRGDEGIRRYWEEKNQLSLDDVPTHILNKSI